MGSASRTVIAAFLLFSTCLSAQTPVAAPPDQFFDSKGVRIRYVERGQGTPIVLLHGYTGTLDRHWINPGVFADLAKDYRVIAMDLRGHGKSGKPHDPDAYRTDMAQDVIRLLDHLQIKRAHLMGYSLGAVLAGHLLTTNPDRFISAVFVAHHAVHTFSEADKKEAEAAAIELEGTTPFKSLFVGLAPPGAPIPSDEEIRKLVQPLVASNDLKALAAFHRARAHGSMIVTGAKLRAIKVPTLGIIGSADPSAPTMRELAPLMPALKVVILEGAEHGGERGVLRRKEFLPAVREFLAAARR